MNVWNIVVYLFLGLLGMGFMLLAMVIIYYDYMKNEEKLRRKLAEMEVGE